MEKRKRKKENLAARDLPYGRKCSEKEVRSKTKSPVDLNIFQPHRPSRVVVVGLPVLDKSHAKSDVGEHHFLLSAKLLSCRVVLEALHLVDHKFNLVSNSPGHNSI